MAYELQRFDEGDILKFKGPVDHFAIYAGEDRIIHYQKRGNITQVTEESIQDYRFYCRNKMGSIGIPLSRSAQMFNLEKHTPEIHTRKPFSGPETVRRARSMLYLKDYNLFGNNCEHFVNWCKYDLKVSDQVQKAAFEAVAGGAAGAFAGAVIGSVVPGVGSATGAIVGGAAGFLVGSAARVGGACTSIKFF